MKVTIRDVKKGQKVLFRDVMVKVVQKRHPSGANPCYALFFTDAGNGLPREARGNEMVTVDYTYLAGNETIEVVE